jgi:hypothetical protein
MPRVTEVIERLFPHGTNPGGLGRGQSNRQVFPIWPPDAFAAAATLVNLSGCYSRPSYAGGIVPLFFKDDLVRKICQVGRTWATLPDNHDVMSEIQKVWDVLTHPENGDVADTNHVRATTWWEAALTLMAFADEASYGVGFFPSNEQEMMSELANLVYDEQDYLAATHYPGSDTTGSREGMVELPDTVRQIVEAVAGCYAHRLGLGRTRRDAIVRESSDLLRGRSDLESLAEGLRADQYGSDRYRQAKALIQGLIDKRADAITQLHETTLHADSGPASSSEDDPELNLFRIPFIPHSLCFMVPTAEVCVQPKAHVPSVGCTLRSFTRHLALLPPEGEVKTSWLFGLVAEAARRSAGRPLNLLLVPFPYVLPDGCFIPRLLPNVPEDQSRFFYIEQKWLSDAEGRQITPKEFTDFILELVERAEYDLRRRPDGEARIHAVVLPELALSESLAEGVAEGLAQNGRLEVFITGVATDRQQDDLPMNRASCFLFHEGRILYAWEQSKHHRWQLEHRQIRRYGLIPAFNEDHLYWEHINIQDRHCAFYTFRPGASLSVLICEDLARIDPVQTVVRAVGPNLVVALLMDGPQLADRWPNRYATVLADDPGSSVLTFTSTGLMRLAQDRAVPRRSLLKRLLACLRRAQERSVGQQPPMAIALWKQACEDSRDKHHLNIDANSHALVLCLKPRKLTCRTHDGRSDEGSTIALEYDHHAQVIHPNPPSWLDLRTHVL